MAGERLVLRSGDLLTTEEMAAALRPRVSTQMLNRYEKEGMCRSEPSRGGKGGKAKMWDPVKVKKALAENKKSASKHGGHRKNATGRKRAKHDDGGKGGLVPAFAAVNTMNVIAGRREPPEGAVQVHDHLYYKPAELEAVVKCAEQIGLTIAHLSAIEAWLKVQERAIALEVTRGHLVKAEDVKRLHTQMLEAVRQRVTEISAKVAAEAGGEMGLDEIHRAKLRGICARIVDEQLGLLAEVSGGPREGAGP